MAQNGDVRKIQGQRKANGYWAEDDMTNQEIITKAIEKALAGGWDFPDRKGWDKGSWIPNKSVFRIDNCIEGLTVKYWRGGNTEHPELNWNIESIIFNHDFAKALWGKNPVQAYDMGDGKVSVIGTIGGEPAWEYHIQQMAVADDKIEYLGESL